MPHDRADAARAPKRLDRGLVLLAAGGCALFLATTVFVVAGAFDRADLALDRVAYAAFGDDRDSAWNLLSQPGSGPIVTAIVATAAVVAWIAGSPRRAALIVVFALVMGATVDAMKDGFGRPYPAHDRNELVVGPAASANGTVVQGYGGARFVPANATDPDDREQWQPIPWRTTPADLTAFPLRPANAYPSGHTMGAFCVAVALLLAARAAQRTMRLDHRAVAAALLVVAVVGVDRWIVRSHWVSDVLGAWGLGAAFVALAILADEALSARWPDSNAD